ncbi:MAG: hypothetical protein EA352_04995 [Gemmatimonadales bacterium]|nr:MAG: hypothetical protein EA352_04995 [Gemmatimonadales bacterium]
MPDALTPPPRRRRSLRSEALRSASLRSARPSPLLALLVAGLLAVAGCADGTPGADLESGDVVQLDSLEVETLYRVGELDGTGWEAFGRVSGVEFMADGSLLIVDPGQSHVVVLDPDGEFVRTFGRQGQGPGEFQSVQRAVVLGSGEIALPDMSQARVHVFGPDGTYRRSVSTPHAEGVPGGRIGAHGESGIVGAKATIIMSAGPGQTPDLPDTRPIGFWELGPDAPEPRNRVIHEAWLPRMETTQTVTVGGFSVGAMTAFLPSLRSASLPDGRVALADSTTYRIQIVDPVDGAVDVLERPHAPWPVTEADEGDHRRYMEEEDSGNQIQIMGPGGPIDASELMRARLENMMFWPERAIIQSLDADRDGRLWVRRSTRNLREEGPVDLLRADGSYLGTLPAGTTIPDAFGPDGLAAWIERDEFDVSYVHVGRITNLP